MIIVKTISDKYFELNGVQYAKIYQPLKQGEKSIGIYNVNDTRQQLTSSTLFSEYQVDGVVYGTQAETIAALLDVVYTEKIISEAVSLVADEEDLTVESNVLKFKDRDFIGEGKKGFKRIRLDFDFSAIPLSYENSIWEIIHFHDLTGVNLVVPEGVVLFFNGGVFSGGNIEFNNNFIKSEYGCFLNPTSISGTVKGFFDAGWLGLFSDGVTDDAVKIQKALNLKGNILIPEGSNYVSKLTVLSDTNVVCKARIISAASTVFDLTGASNFSVDFVNVGIIEGDNVNDLQEAFKLKDVSSGKLKNIKIEKCRNKGFSLSGVSEGISIENVDVSGAISSTGVGVSVFSINVKNCDFSNLKVSGNRIGLSLNGAKYCNVENVVANDCSLAGIMIDGVVSDTGDGGKYNNLTNIICNNAQSATYGGLYLGNGSSYNTMKNIQCHNNTGAGIRLSATIGVNECKGNIFDGFSCVGNSSNGFNASAVIDTILKNGSLKDNTGRGVYFYNGVNLRASDLFISGNTQAGVLYLGCVNTIDENIVSVSNDIGIQVAFGGDYSPSNNRSFRPHLENNISSQYTAASDSKLYQSSGFVVENSGVANISDGGVIVHGLSITPLQIFVTGSKAGEIVTVTAVGSNSITVSIKLADGVTSGTKQDIYWKVSRY